MAYQLFYQSTQGYVEKDLVAGNICKDELKDIECPTLILHGGKDPLVPDFHPEFLNQNIQNSR